MTRLQAEVVRAAIRKLRDQPFIVPDLPCPDGEHIFAGRWGAQGCIRCWTVVDRGAPE